MSQKKKVTISEERKLRNITDYIFSSTSRLLDHAELLQYLAKHKDNFIVKDSDPKITTTFVISLWDVYSRDAVIILGNILDEDKQTSSLFTLVDHIQDVKIKNRYLKRLKAIKLSINPLVRARGNQVAHFNTKLNIHENGHMQINRPVQFDPRYLRRITKRIERFFWDIKEELSIDGLFVVHLGEPIAKSFEKLIGKLKE